MSLQTELMNNTGIYFNQKSKQQKGVFLLGIIYFFEERQKNCGTEFYATST